MIKRVLGNKWFSRLAVGMTTSMVLAAQFIHDLRVR
jgi:hypothetical protein